MRDKGVRKPVFANTSTNQNTHDSKTKTCLISNKPFERTKFFARENVGYLHLSRILEVASVGGHAAREAAAPRQGLIITIIISRIITIIATIVIRTIIVIIVIIVMIVIVIIMRITIAIVTVTVIVIRARGPPAGWRLLLGDIARLTLLV